MSFFRPLEPPDERDEPVAHARPVWSRPDEGELGGFVPMRVVLARSAEHIVLLEGLEAHPSGVAFTVHTRSRTPRVGPMRPDPDDGAGPLRIGVTFSDGRSTEAGWMGWPGPEVGDGPILVSAGGGGGSHDYRQDMWLWPLPPAGSLTFHVVWEDGGIPETSTELDASVFIDASRDAERLWEPLSASEQREAFRALRHRAGGFAIRSMTFGSAAEAESADGGSTEGGFVDE